MTDTTSALIEEAVRAAKYDEAVIVNIDGGGPKCAADDGDRQRKEVVLIASLDEEHGGVRWIDASACAASRDDDEHDDVGEDVDEHEDVDEDVGIARHLRTKRWVMPMLNDDRRNELYDRAVGEACREAVRRLARRRHQEDKATFGEVDGSGGAGKGGKQAGEDGNELNKHGNSDDERATTTLRVLDIGSGTGLLAMLSARHALETLQTLDVAETHEKESSASSTTVEVTTVEMASAMSRLARATISDNPSVSRYICCVEGHSTDPSFVLPHGRRADICTSELLESGLLGEGVLPTMRDAWDRHLTDDAVVVPRGARVYAVAVEGRDACGGYRGPDPDVIKGFRLATSAEDPNSVLLGGSGGGLRVPLRADGFLRSGNNDDGGGGDDEGWSVRVLTEPTEVLSFDFTSASSLPLPSGRSNEVSVVPSASGKVHGVLFWWELDLWEGCTYSTRPPGLGKPGEEDEERKHPFQDHWHQCLYVFGAPHDACPMLVEGEQVHLLASHDDKDIRFNIVSSPCKDDPAGNERGGQPESKRLRHTEILNERKGTPAVEGTTRHCISPGRALQLNDANRLLTFRDALSTALKSKGRSTPLLDLSDFGLCAILAAKCCGATNVTSIESGASDDTARLGAAVAQLGNGLGVPSPQSSSSAESSGNGEDRSMFQVVRCHAEQLTMDVFGGRPAGIVTAEPYYESLEGWHLQEALNFFYLVRGLKRRGVVDVNALLVPCHARMMGCAVQFEGFNAAYGGLRRRRGSSENAMVCGFDHRVVDNYGNRCHSHDVVMPLWQYEYEKMTSPFELARIEYEGAEPTIRVCGSGMNSDGGDSASGAAWVRAPFRRSGACHGMVCWVEYLMRVDENGGDQSCLRTVSTATRRHWQAVRILPEPVLIQDDSTGSSMFCCRVAFGTVEKGEDHTFELRVEK